MCVRNWRITALCRFLKGISDCPLNSINRSAPFGVQLQCTNEKMPSLLLIRCVKRSQAALLSFILVQTLSGSSEVKALFQVHSDTPLNLIYSTLAPWHNLSLAALSYDALLLMFSSSEGKGGWFSWGRIRKQTAVKRLFPRWAGSEKVQERGHCRQSALEPQLALPTLAAGTQVNKPACIQERADALLRQKQQGGNSSTSIIQVFLYLERPRPT